MLEDSPGRICMVFNEEGGVQAMVKNNKKKRKEKKKKHSALNPLAESENSFKQVRRGITFQVPLFYPGKGYTDKRYSHLKIVCYQQPSFAFEIILGIPL